MLGQPSPCSSRGSSASSSPVSCPRARPPPTSCSRSPTCCASRASSGKFVEFYGAGVAALPLANRATIGNMSPEYGSTCAIFPIDDETLDYLRLTGRSDEQVALVEAYAKEQGCGTTRPPSRASPRSSSSTSRRSCRRSPARSVRRTASCSRRPSQFAIDVKNYGVDGDLHLGPDRSPVAASTNTVVIDLKDGAVVIASITSCTNTSNPSVMLAAGAARQEGGREGAARKPWVKTSMAPGLQGRHRTTTRRPACGPTSTSSASTSSATAARPASATPARCPRGLGRRARG
jgi:aconitase A